MLTNQELYDAVDALLDSGVRPANAADVLATLQGRVDMLSELLAGLFEYTYHLRTGDQIGNVTAYLAAKTRLYDIGVFQRDEDEETDE